jgi:hypothetical protein
MKSKQKTSKIGHAISRRAVVKGAAAFAGAAPFIIPSRAFSQAPHPSSFRPGLFRSKRF